MDSLISIIVPVYGVEEYLNRCIESIVNQTYKNLEIILVEDGSPDRCGEICDEWAKNDSRIKVIHQTNGGVSSARNTGLSFASGEYITFVDGDDFVTADMCRVLLNEIQSGDFDIVQYGYSLLYDSGEEKVVNLRRAEFDNYRDILYAAFTYDVKLGIMNFYKSHVTKCVRFCKDLTNAEDMLFFLQSCKKYPKLKVIDKTVYYYFQRNSSSTHICSSKIAIDVVKAMDIIRDDFFDSKLNDAFNYYYLGYCIDGLLDIVMNNSNFDKFYTIRERILEKKYYIFFSKPLCISAGIKQFNCKIKFLTLLLWWCPNVLIILIKFYKNLKRGFPNV